MLLHGLLLHFLKFGQLYELEVKTFPYSSTAVVQQEKPPEYANGCDGGQNESKVVKTNSIITYN